MYIFLQMKMKIIQICQWCYCAHECCCQKLQWTFPCCCKYVWNFFYFFNKFSVELIRWRPWTDSSIFSSSELWQTQGPSVLLHYPYRFLPLRFLPYGNSWLEFRNCDFATLFYLIIFKLAKLKTVSVCLLDMIFFPLDLRIQSHCNLK